MKFLNLKDLQIAQIEEVDGARIDTYTYNFLNNEVSIDLSLKANSNIISDQIIFDKPCSQKGDASFFSFIFCCVIDEMTEEEEEGFFETLVNLTLSSLFEKLVNKDQGRPRERRLAVPENIAANCNVTLSLLKNAINYATVYDMINIDIKLNNRFFYTMISLS